MMTLLLYALCTTALYYLGSRARVSSWLWSRYPPKFARFMDCSACSGFWYGALTAATLGRSLDLRLGALPADSIWTVSVAALGSMIWTPILANAHQQALMALGTAVPEDDDAQPR